MRKTFTEKEMMSDLRNIILGIVQRLGYIFGGGSDIVSPDGQKGPWVFSFCARDVDDLMEEDIDISHLEIARLMSRFYHYAYHGIAPRDEHIMDFVANAEDFIESVRAAEHVSINNHYGSGNGVCVHIYELGFARWCLDHNGSVNLKQLALLAGLDEGTVRNAASKSGDKKLRTSKTLEGRTYVDSEVAYAWLSSKRGFVPTVWHEPDEESDPSDFSDVAGFIRFIRWKRKSQKLSVGDAAKATHIPLFSEERWAAIENGLETPAVTDFGGIAGALKVSEPWLTDKLMAIFYPRQYEMLKGSGSTVDNTDEGQDYDF